jgi:hypothetical protein
MPLLSHYPITPPAMPLIGCLYFDGASLFLSLATPNSEPPPPPFTADAISRRQPGRRATLTPPLVADIAITPGFRLYCSPAMAVSFMPPPPFADATFHIFGCRRLRFYCHFAS